MGAEGSKPDASGHLSPRSQKTAKSLSGQSYFSDVEVSKLYSVFKKASDNGAHMLDRAEFRTALGLLEEAGLKRLDDSPFVDRLFERLDTDGNGKLDLKEFVTGLSMLCKGSVEEKLKLSFECYDKDQNGFIDKAELAEMFKSAWDSGIQALRTDEEKAGKSDDVKLGESTEGELGVFSDEMAMLFADSAFEALDTNKDGLLSFDEFREFALAEPKITATLNGFQRDVSIVL